MPPDPPSMHAMRTLNAYWNPPFKILDPPLYLHTRKNQILEVTKSCEQRLSSVHHVWIMHRFILGMHISSTYVYWLLTCLIPLDMLCSQTMYQPKLFLCTPTIVINSGRGGALKEYQSLCIMKCLVKNVSDLTCSSSPLLGELGHAGPQIPFFQVLLVCSLHIHMKAITHGNNWSLTLLSTLFLPGYQVNFMWA